MCGGGESTSQEIEWSHPVHPWEVVVLPSSREGLIFHALSHAAGGRKSLEAAMQAHVQAGILGQIWCSWEKRAQILARKICHGSRSCL